MAKREGLSSTGTPWKNRGSPGYSVGIGHATSNMPRCLKDPVKPYFIAGMKSKLLQNDSLAWYSLVFSLLSWIVDMMYMMWTKLFLTWERENVTVRTGYTLSQKLIRKEDKQNGRGKF